MYDGWHTRQKWSNVIDYSPLGPLRLSLVVYETNAEPLTSHYKKNITQQIVIQNTEKIKNVIIYGNLIFSNISFNFLLTLVVGNCVS